MKLMTAEVKKRLQKYPLRSQDGNVKSAVCSVKFFLPEGAWTWYVTEANLETGELFGVTINGYGDGELGYFTLQELESLRSSMGSQLSGTSFSSLSSCRTSRATFTCRSSLNHSKGRL